MNPMSENQDPKTKEARPEDKKSADEQAVLQRQSRVDEIIRRRQEAFIEEEKTLFTWKAAQRVFKKRSREYFTTIGAIVVLVCLILLFVQEFLLIAVIGSISFVAYVLATVEPESTEHEISTRGVRTGGKFFRWDELGRFWLDESLGQRILHIETYKVFPRQLVFLVEDPDKMKDLLSPYLLQEKPEPGFLDKASDWMSEKVPLESSH